MTALQPEGSEFVVRLYESEPLPRFVTLTWNVTDDPSATYALDVAGDTSIPATCATTVVTVFELICGSELPFASL
jgi:hypothetical protein